MRTHNTPSDYLTTVTVRDVDLGKLLSGRAQSGDYKTLRLRLNSPEQLSIGIVANWEARLPWQSISNIPLGIDDYGLGALNADAMIQSFTQQSWRGSGPIEVQCMHQFANDDDAAKDVVGKIVALQSLGLPTFWNQLLLPPGPSLVYQDRNRITLEIGRFLRLPSVVIVNAEANYINLLDEAGQPTIGQLQITYRTINVPSREDFIKFFPGRPANMFE